ncbi:MAG: TMEM165/GDT1 family protein [Nocardioides sp.]
MDPVVLALTFAAIFVVELPDKTFLATLVLSTRYRSRPVWIGVGLAFGVQTAVAVAFGQAATLLPANLVRSVALAMFLIGALVLFRTARRAEPSDSVDLAAPVAGPARAEPANYRVIGTAFIVLFAAEWGDLSQVLTLTLAARYDEPGSVFAGAWLALLAVSALAVMVGRELLKRIRLNRLHYVGSVSCLLLAAITAYEMTR